eukprot:GHUV01050055.1.p1 GENE.GHUV01050055.1~~GHUV01050055.1.p1  ORF type:complete len:299 (+),score=46.39 GHUV01050055.1:42-938(+)
MVNHAATYGSTKINFMTTHFFIDTEGDHIPNSYCYKGTNDCLPFTQDVIANWTSSFTKCLQHAVAKGFTGIAVTPHLDGWGQFTPWRNSLRVNPLAKYSGFSYTDIMLVPLAHALNAVMTEDMTVWFALQGEMSLMAMMYPREHQRLLPYLKSLVIKDNPTQASQVRMGLSINFNKLCDGEYCSAASSSNPLLNPAAIQALFQAINFIGISAYPAYTPGSLQGFEDTIMSFVWEIKVRQQQGYNIKLGAANDTCLVRWHSQLMTTRCPPVADWFIGRTGSHLKAVSVWTMLAKYMLVP